MKMVPRICQAYAYQRSLGREGIATELALHVRDRGDPDSQVGNHTSRVRARTPQAIAELFEETERVFANCPHRLFLCDSTTPPEFVAALILRGYEERPPVLRLLLTQPLSGARDDVEFEPVEDAKTWHRLAVLLRMEIAEGGRHGFMRVSDRAVDRLIADYRDRAPTYRLWLAVVNGEDHGHCGSIVCGNRIAIIDDLFVCPQYRKIGIARALLQHGVMHARESGALAVAVAAAPDAPIVPLCTRLGFEPACVARDYFKRRQHGRA